MSAASPTPPRAPSPARPNKTLRRLATRSSAPVESSRDTDTTTTFAPRDSAIATTPPPAPRESSHATRTSASPRDSAIATTPSPAPERSPSATTSPASSRGILLPKEPSSIDKILSLSDSISREGLEELDKAFATLPISQPAARGNYLTRFLHLGQSQDIDPATTTIHLFDSFAYHVAPHQKQPWRVQPWEVQAAAVYYKVFNWPSCGDAVTHLRAGGCGLENCPAQEWVRQLGPAMRKATTAIWGAVKVINSETTVRLMPWGMKRLTGRAAMAVFPGRLDDVDCKRRFEPTMDGARLVPGDEMGVSMTVMRLPEGEYSDGQELEYFASIEMSGAAARTRVCSGKGFGVISTLEGTLWDIDSSNPLSVLRAVFIDHDTWNAQYKTEMAKLLDYMVGKLDNPPFWYISLAPYGLYPFLRSLRDERYPFGVLLMKNAPWSLASELLAAFMVNAKQYKLEYLQRIYQTWPKRRMILVGSATECDAEAFAEMYSQQPSWIEAMLLRRDPVYSWSNYCTDQVLGRIFLNVPKKLWCVFSDAESNEAYFLVNRVKLAQGMAVTPSV